MSTLHLTLIIPAGLTHLVLELVEAPTDSVLQEPQPAAVEPTPEPAPEPEPTPLEPDPPQKKRYIGA